MIPGFDHRSIDLKSQLLDLDRADAEESLYEFLKTAWRIFDSAPWVDGWCIEAMAEHLQAIVDGQIKRLIINIPPRCNKSSIGSIVMPAWTWAQPARSHTSGPGVSFMYASFKDALALRDSINCRKVIESRWYQDRWGDRFQLSDDQNTKSRFNNSEGGYRLVTSVESKGATGDGANIIFLDDCNSTKEIESEAVIASTTDWFDGTLGTRLNNPKLGAIVEIQQRVGEYDLTGHILEKKGGDWVHLYLPMRYEKDRHCSTKIGWTDPRSEEGELLWPERFGEDEVKGLETWMGPWRAAGQLQQRPEPRGGGIIKREWWKLWEEEKFPYADYKIGCLDTAYTLKQMNDPSGMIVWGVFSQESQLQQSAMRIMDANGQPMYMGRSTSEEVSQVMLMNAWTERLEFHQLIEKVVKTAVDYNIDLLMIENKAAGISIAQEIRRLYANENFSVQLFDPKSQDKFARLVSVQPLFQEGLIWAPDTKFAEAVMTQCSQFPRGKHDEYVDMTSMGLRWLRDTGILSRKNERRVEVDAMLEYQGNQNEPLYPG